MLAVVVPRLDFLTRLQDATAAKGAMTMTTQHHLEYLCAQKGANQAVLDSLVSVAHAANSPPHEGGPCD